MTRSKVFFFVGCHNLSRYSFAPTVWQTRTAITGLGSLIITARVGGAKTWWQGRWKRCRLRRGARLPGAPKAAPHRCSRCSHRLHRSSLRSHRSKGMADATGDNLRSFDPWQAYWIPWQDWAWNLGRPKEKVMAKKDKVIGNGWGMGKGKEKAKKEKVMEKTLKEGQGKEMGKERGRAERGGKSPPLAWTLRAGWRAGWIGF